MKFDEWSSGQEEGLTIKPVALKYVTLYKVTLKYATLKNAALKIVHSSCDTLQFSFLGGKR